MSGNTASFDSLPLPMGRKNPSFTATTSIRHFIYSRDMGKMGSMVFITAPGSLAFHSSCFPPFFPSILPEMFARKEKKTKLFSYPFNRALLISEGSKPGGHIIAQITSHHIRYQETMFYFASSTLYESPPFFYPHSSLGSDFPLSLSLSLSQCTALHSSENSRRKKPTYVSYVV